MTKKHARGDDLSAHCGELHADDRVDPRQFFQEPRRTNHNQRKARQLCHQVAETLDMVLSGEFADEMLQGLHVLSVQPAPDATQLSVVVAYDHLPVQVTPAEVLQRLSRVTGRLRSEVAAAISRKRVPRLIFQVVSAGHSPEEVT